MFASCYSSVLYQYEYDPTSTCELRMKLENPLPTKKSSLCYLAVCCSSQSIHISSTTDLQSMDDRKNFSPESPYKQPRSLIAPIEKQAEDFMVLHDEEGIRAFPSNCSNWSIDTAQTPKTPEKRKRVESARALGLQ